MIADYLGQSRLPHPRQSTSREGGGHVEVYEDRRFGAAYGCHHGNGGCTGSSTVGILRRCPIDAGGSTQACGSAGRREDGSAFLLRGGAVWLRAVPAVDDDGLRLLCRRGVPATTPKDHLHAIQLHPMVQKSRGACVAQPVRHDLPLTDIVEDALSSTCNPRNDSLCSLLFRQM